MLVFAILVYHWSKPGRWKRLTVILFVVFFFEAALEAVTACRRGEVSRGLGTPCYIDPVPQRAGTCSGM
jgi:hypothetical protein